MRIRIGFDGKVICDDCRLLPHQYTAYKYTDREFDYFICGTPHCKQYGKRFVAPPPRVVLLAPLPTHPFPLDPLDDPYLDEYDSKRGQL